MESGRSDHPSFSHTSMASSLTGRRIRPNWLSLTEKPSFSCPGTNSRSRWLSAWLSTVTRTSRTGDPAFNSSSNSTSTRPSLRRSLRLSSPAGTAMDTRTGPCGCTSRVGSGYPQSPPLRSTPSRLLRGNSRSRLRRRSHPPRAARPGSIGLSVCPARSGCRWVRPSRTGTHFPGYWRPERQDSSFRQGPPVPRQGFPPYQPPWTRQGFPQQAPPLP